MMWIVLLEDRSFCRIGAAIYNPDRPLSPFREIEKSCIALILLYSLKLSKSMDIIAISVLSLFSQTIEQNQAKNSDVVGK